MSRICACGKAFLVLHYKETLLGTLFYLNAKAIEYCLQISAEIYHLQSASYYNSAEQHQKKKET